MVNSTGWQAPQLVPVDTGCPKSFKCFEFRAKPPTGITNPVITPVSADCTLENWEHVKNIKIIGETNSITKKVDVEKPKTLQRVTYFGPVLLTKYAVDNALGHIFYVDDSSKLQGAVAVRVPADRIPMVNLMVYAYQEGKKVAVTRWGYFGLPEGKTGWSIWSARIEKN